MKIVFSTKYTSMPWTGGESCIFNTTFVGEQGLLELLELKAGLTGAHISALEREADYYVALKKYKEQNEETFYAKSFDIDDWGVSRELLIWRDSLIMAGWNSDCITGLTRIDQLAEADKNFNLLGAADRWCEVMKVCEEKSQKGDSLLGKDDKIVVMCERELIPPLIYRVLNTFGSQVEWDQLGLRNHPDKLGKIKLYKFKDRQAEMHWLVTNYEAADNLLIVNRDNRLLNDILGYYGKPKVDSYIENANTNTIQLFNLGFALYNPNIDPYVLASYLMVEENPLPKSVRKKLHRELLKSKGLGSEWDAIVTEWEKDSEISKKRVFLSQLDNKGEKIAVEAIRKYISALKKWANSKAQKLPENENIENQKTELRAIVTMCRVLENVIPEKGEIEYKTLNRAVKNIYKPITLCNETAEKGSYNIVGNIGEIAAPIDCLIWTDCNGRGEDSYKYDFLLTDEIDTLKKYGIEIKDKASILQAERTNREKALSYANKIIIATAERDKNSALEAHPLVTEILNSKTPVTTITDAETAVNRTEETECKGFKTSAEYTIDREITSKRRESATSIETLIQFPFNYLMEYIAKAKEWECEAEPNQGTIAHLVIEKIFSDNHEARPIEESRRRFDEEYEQIVEESITEKGIVLNKREKQLDKTKFTEILRKSITTLFEIINENGYRVIGCEKHYEATIEEIGDVEANIDMLLEKEGKYIVADFKWTDNIKKYSAMIEEDRSIQLELYKKVVEKAENCEVIESAYFLLQNGKWLTTNEKTSGGNSVVKLASKEHYDTWNRVVKSVELRRKQLKDKKIEEGELMDQSELSYVANHEGEANNYIPLNLKKYTNKKASSWGSLKDNDSSYNYDDEDMSTKYNIIKNRIK